MQCQMSARTAILKRKRRSSDNFANIENEPVHEEKKPRDDRSNSEDGDGSSDERLPLSELSVLRLASGKDREKGSRIDSEAERLQLQISDEDNEASTSFHAIDLSPGQPDNDFFSLTADEILADDPEQPSTSQEPEPPKLSLLQQRFGNRLCPLPALDPSDELSLWNILCRKDVEEQTRRDPNLFSKHPSLQPRMRAVLLEWIIEVCDVYKLHRETYFLAMDYLDRYLGHTKNIPKVQLQLIGITCLLIASKVEEIYPPKVSEFAYVTDGACCEEDIIKMELNIVKTLDWKFRIITANTWLCIYMQLCYRDTSRPDLELLYPTYPGELFSKIAQLLDLATLDASSLKYSYGVLAAGCLSVVCSQQVAEENTGFSFSDISECVRWLEAYWEAIQDEKTVADPPMTELPPGPSKTAVPDYSHFLQTHNISLDLLEAGQSILELRCDTDTTNINILTPPSSSKKSA